MRTSDRMTGAHAKLFLERSHKGREQVQKQAAGLAHPHIDAGIHQGTEHNGTQAIVGMHPVDTGGSVGSFLECVHERDADKPKFDALKLRKNRVGECFGGDARAVRNDEDSASGGGTGLIGSGLRGCAHDAVGFAYNLPYRPHIHIARKLFVTQQCVQAAA